MSAVLPIMTNGVTALVALLAVAACAEDDYSRHKRQQIAANFERAVPAVATFRHTHKRLPTTDELNKILGTSGEPLSVMISSSGFGSCDKDLPIFSHPASGSNVLATWRGEWLECFDPVTRRSSL